MAAPKLEIKVEEDMVIVEVGEPVGWKMIMTPLEAAIFASNLNVTVSEILDRKTKNH